MTMLGPGGTSFSISRQYSKPKNKFLVKIINLPKSNASAFIMYNLLTTQKKTKGEQKEAKKQEENK